VSGKTGTTENYGDAWFVGWTRDYTVAVWVGYPDRFKAMKTDFRGDPVSGGTYPAGIWKTFMEQVLKVDPPSQSERDDKEREPDVPGVMPTPGALPSAPSTAAPSAPATTGQGGGPDDGGGTDGGAPAQEEVPATGGTTPDTGADAGTGETPVAPVDPGAQAAPDGQAAPADPGVQP
jgi:penicillin-binding protein 1A